MNLVSNTQSESELNSRTSKINPNDIEQVLNMQETIKKMVAGNDRLAKFIGDVEIMFSLVKDFVHGVYRDVAWATVAAIVAALIYVISPIDLIPDLIPVVGLFDDASIVGICIAMVGAELQKYASWKKSIV